jgi:hypothetical protein
MDKATKILLTILLALTLSACKTLDTFKDEKNRDGIKETTLIDREKIVTEGEESIEKNVESGPKPKVLKKPKEAKRKTLTTENVKNYVSIPDTYKNLKQEISINFQGLDFKYAMGLMADIGEINIIVGEEVSGDTTLLPGEILSLYQAERITKAAQSAGDRPPFYIPILLGLTKASLNSDSFISAASF